MLEESETVAIDGNPQLSKANQDPSLYKRTICASDFSVEDFPSALSFEKEAPKAELEIGGLNNTSHTDDRTNTTYRAPGPVRPTRNSIPLHPPVGPAFTKEENARALKALQATIALIQRIQEESEQDCVDA